MLGFLVGGYIAYKFTKNCCYALSESRNITIKARKEAFSVRCNYFWSIKQRLEDIHESKGLEFSEQKCHKLMYVAYGMYAEKYNKRLFKPSIINAYAGPFIPIIRSYNWVNDLSKSLCKDIYHFDGWELPKNSKLSPEIEEILDNITFLFSSWNGGHMSTLLRAEGSLFQKLNREGKLHHNGKPLLVKGRFVGPVIPFDEIISFYKENRTNGNNW